MMDVSPLSGPIAHAAEHEEMIVTSIRATDVALGLRRIPAGFYAVVRHSGLEWRTENKPSSVNVDVVEWNGRIPIPSDLSTTIHLKIYATFTFQHMLGDGEQLRTLTITVGQLLERSEKCIPFTYLPMDGDVVSPCSSLLVAVERRKWEYGDLLEPRALDPSRPVLESRDELEDTTNQGHSSLSRYRKHGESQDLKRSIEKFEQALRTCKLDHPCHMAAQSNLAMSKFVLSQVEDSDVSSLEVPLALYRNSLAARPVGNLDRPSTLIQLAAVYFARFEKRKDEVEREMAETLLYEAMELSPTDSHEFRVANFMHQLHIGRRADSLHAGSQSVELDTVSPLTDEDSLLFSDQLLERFERFGDLRDLQRVITVLEELVESTSISDDWHHAGLANLGVALSYRFEHFGELHDLEGAISRHKQAADLTPRGHRDKPGRLNNLGNALKVRFKRLGELCDLQNAISTLSGAIDTTPHYHPVKLILMKSLGASLRARFERLGEVSDLERAISTLSDVLDLTRFGHPDKPSRLRHLGNAFKCRFEHSGDVNNLEDAISMLKDAVSLTRDGHPERPSCLQSLGNALLARFRRLGGLSDLDNAVSMLRNAVDLTPHGHFDKPARLANLGTAFHARFQHLGELSDLERAITTRKDAVDLIPCGHPWKPALLSNLGNTLRVRFERIGQTSDLEDAISVLKDAVNLTPHSRPAKPGRLYNLFHALHTRFKRFGDLADVQDAISALKGGTDLIPDGHPHKPILLSGLGASLKAQFKRSGQLNDLNEAISKHKDALDLTPDAHPGKSARLFNLGGAFLTRFIHLGKREDIEQAISQYSPAASTSVGPVGHRFRAAKQWILCAQYIRHHTLLDAYSVAISLLPQLAWIGLPLARRYDELKLGADVVRGAAAAALDSGRVETAVEWLEEGRSIVWGELFQLRGSYEELSSAHPDHALRLRELSSALEHAGATHENSLSQLSGQEQTHSTFHHATESLQGVAERHRSLAIERDKLIQEIRGFPGFERFLLHKEFSQLRGSAHSGPVVILNAAESRCDALIIRTDVDRVVHVPLPNFTFQRSTGLQKMLVTLLGHARVVRFEAREGKVATRGGISWESLLSTLWVEVVKPVLDALGFSTPGDLSRIFWCPTGPFVFLPIHAGGFYDIQHSQPGHKASDFVISSYVPTLTILAQSSGPDMTRHDNLRLLAVRQPLTDGLPRLPGVTAELNHIKQVISSSPSACATLFESSSGTVEEVLALMEEADWVHFACHGIQDGADSGLCLADGRRLNLRDTISLSRPRGGLAFLSACQTATGEECLSDEAIHVAAGMLFAGYGGVVGTMWSISDKLAPDVARDVYGHLFGSGVRPDYREAARALHEAVGRLRDSGRASFVTWLPFIHVGL